MSKKRSLRAISILLSVMMIMTCFILPSAEVSAFSGGGTMVPIVIDNVTKKYKASFDLFDRINAYRAEKNLAPWSDDKVLFDAAMEKAVELSVHVDHDYDPEQIYDKSEDVKTKDTGIIIAYASSNFSMFFENMNSEESRIMNSTDTYVTCGAAVVEVGNMKYACVFVSNKAPEPVEDSMRTKADETADYSLSCPISYLENVTFDGADKVEVWRPGIKYHIPMKIVQNVKTSSNNTDTLVTPLDESCTVIETENDPDIIIDGSSVICSAEKSSVIFRVSLKGTDNIYKIIERKFIADDISAVVTVDKIPDQNYTGKPIEPVLVVKRNGVALKADKDYTVEYFNNIYEGTARAVITGKGSYKGTKTVEFVIVNNGFSVKFDSPPIAISAGVEKEFKAVASRYSGSVTYRFELSEKDKDRFICLKDFSADNTVSINLSVIGAYTLRVTAKDSQSECISQIDFSVAEPLSVEFSDGGDTVYINSLYKFTAKGKGGIAPYKYALYYKAPGTDREKAFASFRDDPVFSIDSNSGVFNTEGEYVLILKCKDSSSTVVSAEKKVRCIKNGAFVNTTKLSAEYSDDLVNKPVYFIPSCTGGSGTITYKYYYDKSGDFYKYDRDINRASWVNITTKVTENDNRFPTLSQTTIKTISEFKDGLPIKVTVTDANGNTDTVLLFLKLVYEEVENVENKSGISAEPIPDSQINAQYAVPVGSDVTLYGQAEKGTEPYSFKFQYTFYTHDISSLYDYRDWKDISSTGNYAVMKCEDTLTYAFKVTVTDKNNTSDIKFFLVKSYSPLKNKSYMGCMKNNNNVYKTISGNPYEMYGYAEGGISPYTFDYYYQKENSSQWNSIASSKKPLEYVYFTPESAGNYKVKIIAKDCVDGLTKENIYNCNVADHLKNNSNISKEQCFANEEVTLKGLADGGFGDYNYGFSYRFETDSEWTELPKDFEKQNVKTFKPEKTGHYQIKITAEDKAFDYNYSTGNKLEKRRYQSETTEKTFDLDVIPRPLENISSVNKELISVGSRFIINGAAKNGKPPYKYTYEYKRTNKNAWVVIGDKESSELSAKLKPSSTGEFDIRVTVQDSNGQKSEKYFTVKASGLENTSSLKSEKILLGEYVNIIGSGESGAEPYTYNYFYRRSTNNKWIRIGTKDTSETAARFKPTAAVDYDIRVTVTDKFGMTVSKTMKVSVITLKNESTVSAKNIIAGRKLYIYGKASGGDSSAYTYTYYYKKNSAAKWSRIGEVNTKAEMVYFKPQTASEYLIRVVVTDAKGVSSAKKMSVNVFALENNSAVVTKEPVAGKSVVIKGAASGGTAPYTYSYYYRRTGNAKWNLLGTQFTSAEKVSFKPQKAVSYDVRVIVKDANGLTLEKTMTVSVH